MWLKQSINHYIFVNRIIGGEIDERDRKDYFSPSTDLFSDYCSSIIERYGLDEPGQILQREATDLSYNYLSDSSDSKVFTVSCINHSINFPSILDLCAQILCKIRVEGTKECRGVDRIRD